MVEHTDDGSREHAPAAVPARYADLSWRQRLEHVVETMREVSRTTDPMEMTSLYGKRMRGTVTNGRLVSFSRRGLTFPNVRITRYSHWRRQPDPWRETAKLPMIKGGLLADLIYANEPRILAPLVYNPDDPAREYIEHAASAVAIPQYENGEALNMVLLTSHDPQPMDPERFPDLVLQSNLIGRGTRALVLGRELREAYNALDRELRSVQDMQMALLPREIPAVPGLELAALYQTSTHAGGDYYDFFKLGEGRTAILVADVSGHGTPAAVLMAIVHAVAHLVPGLPCPPDRVLQFVNNSLCERYTLGGGNFVTMVFGIFDAATREFTFASAGHPDPVRRHPDGRISTLPHPDAGLPLGIISDCAYSTHATRLDPGDSLVLYTDGITEAFGPGNELFGDERFRAAVSRAGSKPDDIVSAVLQDLGEFAGLASRNDDRTLVAARVL
ncbi:MAG: PP2C family protein-serine/threonine phosphatase [Planctomycetota bacterium]|nr:PP2C family protein-serine/threonine phosphatase [Planctomycetota bacterium]